MGITVLSLFDGISCGQLALKNTGIKVDKYFASEIDKSAIKVTQHHFPNTIQLGDVTKVSYKDGILKCENGDYRVGRIDILIAGSPCQSFSNMGAGDGFDGESGLFNHFLRILKEVNPEHFFLENVMMKDEWKNTITNFIGVEPIFLNSSIVSAQSRKRLYWTNIYVPNSPRDRNLILKDVLEDIEEPKSELILKDGNKFTLNESFLGGEISFREWCRSKGIVRIITSQYNIDVEYPEQKWISSEERKNMPRPKAGEGVRANRYRVEHIRGLNDKSRCIAASCSSISNTSGTGVFHNGVYRRLTCLEVERLQQLPDNYTAILPESKRYHAIGNGWTIGVIEYFFSNLK